MMLGSSSSSDLSKFDDSSDCDMYSSGDEYSPKGSLQKRKPNLAMQASSPQSNVCEMPSSTQKACFSDFAKRDNLLKSADAELQNKNDEMG